MKATVRSFDDAASIGYPGWWLLALEGEEMKYLVHNNWVAVNGVLKTGSKVTLEHSDIPVYRNSEYGFVKSLQVSGKEVSQVA